MLGENSGRSAALFTGSRMARKSSQRTVLTVGSTVVKEVVVAGDNVDIGAVEIMSTEDLKEMETAKAVGDILQAAYPDHLWAVFWQGGAIVVKNMAIEDGRYGMILDNAERYSASALKKHAIMSAGELLERVGASRGRWNGEMYKNLDKTGA